MLENGASCSLPLSKQKRMRTFVRQERVMTRKDGEKDGAGALESERASPIIQTLQSILPKYLLLCYTFAFICVNIFLVPRSPKSNNYEIETTESRQRILAATHLQLPPGPLAQQQLVQSRSQTMLKGSSGTSVSPATGTCSSTPASPASQSILNIPTLAVTPVSTSTPNIVIEQYPTILRVVSLEEMNATTEASTSSSLPILTRASSYIGKQPHSVISCSLSFCKLARVEYMIVFLSYFSLLVGSANASTNTLQVPCFAAIDSMTLSPSQQHGSSKLKVKAEENLKRSISNPGVSTSPVLTPAGSNGHCPVLRTGAALGCNYCWNTNDSHGRILRRKTKYHCPDCQANLCIVPCFQVSSSKKSRIQNSFLYF